MEGEYSIGEYRSSATPLGDCLHPCARLAQDTGREQLPVLPAGTWVPVRFTTTWIRPQGWDYLIPPLSLPTASAPCRLHGQQSPQGRGAGSLMVPRTRPHFFRQCCSTPFRNGAPQFSSFPETPNHSATPLAPPLPPGVARESWRHKRPRSTRQGSSDSNNINNKRVQEGR